MPIGKYAKNKGRGRGEEKGGRENVWEGKLGNDQSRFRKGKKGRLKWNYRMEKSLKARRVLASKPCVHETIIIAPRILLFQDIYKRSSFLKQSF